MRAGFSLPGVGGRGRGLNTSVVASLAWQWVEDIVFVGADVIPIDNVDAERLFAIGVTDDGSGRLSAAVIERVRSIDGAAQRAMLIALAHRQAGYVLPLVGGLTAAAEVNGWLLDTPYPKPSRREQRHMGRVSMMVAAYAAGNNVLGERVLASVAAGPEGARGLALILGWLIRVAVAVLAEAYRGDPPISPADSWLPDPSIDSRLPEGDYLAIRQAITQIIANVPMPVQQAHAAAMARADDAPLIAAVRYAAVTIAGHVRPAMRLADATATAKLDPDLRP